MTMTLQQAKQRFEQLFRDTDPEPLAVVLAALDEFESFKRVYDESIIIMNEQMQELSQLRTHSVEMTRQVTELRAKVREWREADADPRPEVPVLQMQRKEMLEGATNTDSVAEALKRADVLCPPRNDGKAIAFVPTMRSPKKLEHLHAQTSFFMGTLAKRVRAQQAALERIHTIVMANLSWSERRDSPQPTYEIVHGLLARIAEIWRPE